MASNGNSHSNLQENMDFHGKAVIVTGSSRGIGRAVALAFVKSGASVTIHGQNPDKLNETKELMKQAGAIDKQIVTVLGPIQEEETVNELVQKTVAAFGKIDILINNAGIEKNPDVPDTHSLANFDYLFAVNLRSIVQLTQLASPHLAKTKGAVINISSIVALMPLKQDMYYGMTKAALDHYTRDMANVLGQQGIRVNSISPGPIDSDFLSRFGGDEAKLKMFKEMIAKNNIIAQRWGTCEEVADTILYMASPKASYIWGASLIVDGGTHSFTQW